MVTLAVIGIIGSVIAAFYYLRVVKIIYLDEVEDPITLKYNLSAKIILGVTSFLVLGFLFYAKSVVNFINYIGFAIV